MERDSVGELLQKQSKDISGFDHITFDLRGYEFWRLSSIEYLSFFSITIAIMIHLVYCFFPALQFLKGRGHCIWHIVGTP